MMTPVATCVGGAFSCCFSTKISCFVEKKGYFTHNDKKQHLLAYLLILCFGFFGLYVPLTIICAKADDAEWALFKGDGKCWSTEGYTNDAPGVNIGRFAGIFIGVGVGGLVVTLLRKTKEYSTVGGDVENQDKAEAKFPVQVPIDLGADITNNVADDNIATGDGSKAALSDGVLSVLSGEQSVDASDGPVGNQDDSQALITETVPIDLGADHSK